MNQLTTQELNQLARQAMIFHNFVVDFPHEVLEEVEKLKQKSHDFLDNSSIRDLRSLLWSSIDDASSRDLDQVEYTEQLPNGNIKVLIGIADVDEFVPKGSPIDIHAAKNTITVYTGSIIFPMLPEEISTDLTSLLNDVDRLAVVIEMVVSENGNVVSKDIYRGLLHNYAKLSYEEIGAWLDENTDVPASVSKVEGMKEQILLQFKAAKRLRDFREKNGSLKFETVEAAPVIKHGHITSLKIFRTNSAREIIENFMISANVSMAEFLEHHQVISLRRVVKTPRRWDRIVEVAASYGVKLPKEADSIALSEFLEQRKLADSIHFPDLSLSIVKLLGPGEYTVQLPNEEIEGHFGLAVRDYSHSTAPNRRYSDIVTQRLVKSILENKPVPYESEELKIIAKLCNERMSAAQKIERQMQKSIAASVLASDIGKEFEAIVTGVKPATGTFARILNPPADGRIVRGEQGLQVGEKINVRLIATDPHKGFIDFAYEK